MEISLKSMGNQPTLLGTKSKASPTIHSITSPDANFNNSPGHCSSQDGSFIQDEDMHLILEFGGFNLPSHITSPPGASLAHSPCFYSKLGPKRRAIFDCVLPDHTNNITNALDAGSDVVIGRRRAEWATNFDADVVAQLDFDDFSAQRDMALLNGEIPCCDQISTSDLRYTYDDLSRQNLQNSFYSRQKAARRARRQQKILRGGDSMETSLLFDVSGEGGVSSSIFSAYGNDENDNFVFDIDCNMDDNKSIDNIQSTIQNGKAQTGAFISTDSLDFSSLSLAEENLRQACATNKREYVLTFDKNAFENGLVIFSTTAASMGDSTLSNNGRPIETRETFITSRDLGPAGQWLSREEPGPCLISDCCKENSIKREDSHGNDAEETYNDDIPNNNVVTWGRIKRSYDQCETNTFNPSSKFTSLPDLKPSPSSNLACGGEKLASQGYLDIYSANDNNNNTLQKGDSLLKVFQQQQQNLHKYSTPGAFTFSESGYLTGTGSNINNFNENFANNTNVNFENCNYTLNLNKNTSDKGNYDEFYLNGLNNVDMNHNEIGYTPPFGKANNDNLEDISENDDVMESMSVNKPPAKPPRSFVPILDNNSTQNYFKPLHLKDFGDLKFSDQSVQTANHDDIKIDQLSTTDEPDLEFLKFPFEIPPLKDHLTPFLLNFLNDTVEKSTLLENVKKNEAKLQNIQCQSFDDTPKLATNYSKFNKDDLKHHFDVGEGPAHIEDWDSLATLLPDNVVKTCQFFHQNSHVFSRRGGGGSIDKPTNDHVTSNYSKQQKSHISDQRSNCTNKKAFDLDNGPLLPPIYERLCLSDVGHCKRCSPHNNYDREKKYCRPHCYLHQRFSCCHCCCCCQHVARDDRLERWAFDQLGDLHSQSLYCGYRKCGTKPDLMTSSSDTLGNKVCDEKVKLLTTLIEKIGRCVSEIKAAFIDHQSVEKHTDEILNDEEKKWSIGAHLFDSLCPTLECLLTDGLRTGKTICDVMKASVFTDSITTSVCNLVAGGNNVSNAGGKNRERSLQFAIFIDSLLSSKSLDVWVTKLISDQNVLAKNFLETAYLRLLSSKKCTNLLDGLKSCLKSLSHLPFEKLNLINVEINANENANPDLDRCQSFVNDQQDQQKSPLAQFISTNGHKRSLSSLVILQKELRIVFRFPSKVLLYSPTKSIFCMGKVDSGLPVKTSIFNKISTINRSLLANDSRIPRNLSPSNSILRFLDNGAQNTSASTSPQRRSEKLKAVVLSPEMASTKSRIPVSSHRPSWFSKK